ncbi:hypothetical protein BDA96_04G196100 [Sorghum bicolor]|uniref:ABA-responsive LEA-like protein n=1 Tax=Sorghum bicolor TaxID=4558 RepID=A0A921R7A5_SORBI|nr:hypothetical protein BDA96_04G196100 [Sorghum bicolor]
MAHRASCELVSPTIADFAVARGSSKEVFWMRDPQTGCWAPEDRFADVDAAELRARLLARKD